MRGGYLILLQADFFRQRFRQHGEETARQVGGEAAFCRFLIKLGTVPDPGGNVGNVYTQSDFILAGDGDGQSIIKVAGIRLVDGDGGKLRHIFPFDFCLFDG